MTALHHLLGQHGGSMVNTGSGVHPCHVEFGLTSEADAEMP